jgi:hypothetical protein
MVVIVQFYGIVLEKGKRFFMSKIIPKGKRGSVWPTTFTTPTRKRMDMSKTRPCQVRVKAKHERKPLEKEALL